MRILHIAHQYLPEHVGGVEHYTRGLALAQRQSGHQVALFCRRSAPGQRLEQESVEGLTVYRTTNGVITPLRRFRASLGDRYLTSCLHQVIQETDPDLIHVQHLMGLPVNGVASAVGFAPVVVTLHDYWWICANANLITDYGQRLCRGPCCWLNCARCGLARAGADRGWALAPLAALPFVWRAVLLRQLRGRAAAWIAPTPFVAEWYVAHGFPAKRVHVVPHGADTPPPGLALRTRHEAGPATLHLAYIGGLAPQKGVHILIAAVNGLDESVRLVVAGDESAFPDYCGHLRRMAAHPGIDFLGRLDRGQVWQVLADSDALIVPSLSYETASLVISEAFAVRTPVIASNQGALGQRVRHEVDGLLVPPGDALTLRAAICRLVEEPDLLARLRRGIRPVPTLVTNAEQVEAIYRQVLGRQGGQ